MPKLRQYPPYSRFLVIGASGRMTAAMLRRLGLDCSVIDLFGDCDTQSLCNGRVITVNRLSDVLMHKHYIRNHEWTLFVGGLESQVEVARKIAHWSKPAFTSIDSLVRVSEPAMINHALEECNISNYPMKLKPEDEFPVVAKSLHGSGRAKLIESKNDTEISPEDSVYQQFIRGDSVSLVFVNDQFETKLLGGSFQLVKSMRWIGSVSGLKLTDEESRSATDFAASIAKLSGLVGVFGVDFIRNRNGLWPVDLNPRIPASAEIVGDHVMQAHLSAFGIASGPVPPPSVLCEGKQVLFNEMESAFTISGKQKFVYRDDRQDDEDAFSIADVPQMGHVIEPGCPILSVFATGQNAAIVRTKLNDAKTQILSMLGMKASDSRQQSN